MVQRETEQERFARYRREQGSAGAVRVGNIMVTPFGRTYPVPTIVPMPRETSVEARRRAYDGFGL